jgi:glycosyltransferase involved in cell wall biosynthesis
MRRKKRPVRRLKSSAGLRNNAEKRLERYRLGLSKGYEQGLKAGLENYEAYFEGISIIIPSDNEAESVKACIEGIIDHTDLAYEIIVIDNSSTDGIEHYLNQLDGQVRYRILPESIGFTGAANIGFMMAKGTSIMLLNNRIQPTENWLENLLLCLNSEDSIGMVGPVSNGLSGKQRMEIYFDDLEDKDEYARVNNISDSSKWHQTDRLSGRCLLFRRELLERVGYLDEGCQETPYYADDYGLRVKLQGYSLVYARDAYVNFAEQREESVERRLSHAGQPDSSIYFSNKWKGIDSVIFDMEASAYDQDEWLKGLSAESGAQLGESAFYPQHLAVKGLGETIYWIEDCVRRPINGKWGESVIHLSQLDLWRWTMGEPVPAEALSAYKGSLGADKAQRDGMLCEGSNGSSYYLENGRKRAIISRLAAECWGLDTHQQMKLTDEELSVIPDGLPIIAPIKLLQAL